MRDASESAPTLTRFNLDFPGGTPKDLVDAIQKAMGKPLNAIIPNEHANMELPQLKMNNVTTPELFQALIRASSKLEIYSTPRSGGYSVMSPYQQMQTSCGFRTEGKVTDDSIWYFYAEKPNLTLLTPMKTCRFYSLTPYLDRGLKVDDITTAIQTGWKMLGEDNTPTISFHKDTKLLIAVGEPGKLETIDAVLKALEPPRPAFLQRIPGPLQPAGKPEAAPKADE